MSKFEYDMYSKFDDRTTAIAKGGLNLCDVLLLIFIVLKLCKIINWSWWWVLSPFWIPLGLYIALIIVVLIVRLIYKLIHR